MTMKLFTHKKGVNMPDVGEGIAAVVLGIMFFAILFSLISLSGAEVKKNVQEKQALLDGAHILRSFLQMPVTPDFSEGSVKALASDLHSRGVHVVDLLHIINPHPENEDELNLKQVFQDQHRMISQTTQAELTITFPGGAEIVTGAVATDGSIAVEEVFIPTKKPGVVLKARLRTAYGGPTFYR